MLGVGGRGLGWAAGHRLSWEGPRGIPLLPPDRVSQEDPARQRHRVAQRLLAASLPPSAQELLRGKMGIPFVLGSL